MFKIGNEVLKNKRPMGHIAYLMKTVEINKHIRLLGEKKPLSFENWMVPYLDKLESPSPRGALCQLCLKLDHWFWRRRFLNFVNVFLIFLNYLPLEKCGALHLNKLESPLPKDALCQIWSKLAQWFWRRRILNFVNVFFATFKLSPLGKVPLAQVS